MTEEKKWRPNLFEISKKPLPLSSGHRMCAGCTAPIIVKMAFAAAPDPGNTIVVNATGCLEVATTIFPYTAWNVPWIHGAFENAGAIASGVETAYKVLKRKGRWEDEKPYVLVFAGDGGTYDIGLQALSGAVERGHKFVWVLYDNEAYMNTGIQRSGSTPEYASTTTSPAGKVLPGKIEWKKPIAHIIAAHHNAYVATVSIAFWGDFMKKVRKAFEYDGPSFIHAIMPCDRGWYFDTSLGVEISKIAVETCFHPLWEFDPETREYKITDRSAVIAKKPELKKPIEEYLKLQGRFRHLFKPTKREDLIREIQERVDKEWEYLLHLAGFKD